MFTDFNIVDDPFNAAILPLSKRYEEIVWFADDKVAATKEKSGATQSVGWTHDLSQLKNSEGKLLIQAQKDGGKYIELERMLSSVVCLHLFLDGSKSAYEKFTSLQKPEEKLKWKSFLEIHQFLKKVANTKERFQALEAMLVFSDAGKTPIAVAKAESHGLRKADHDDFIEALFHQKKEVIGEVLPSFKLLTFDLQELLIKVSSAMPIHLGHVSHLEGGSGMFANFEKAIREGKVTKELLDFAFMILMCDVSASLAHVNNQGSLSFTEDTYQGYQLVKKVLEAMVEGENQKDALSHYLRLRADRLEADITDPKQRFLVRMACWMRLYKKEDYLLLKSAMRELPEDTLQVALEQFDMETGINTWKRNPTYGPAVLINLANFQNFKEEKQVKIKRALEGAFCLALWCKEYALKTLHSDTPVNFNEMAGIAATYPEKFQLKKFNALDFEPNEKNLVIFRSKEPSVSTVGIEKVSSPLTWAKDKEDTIAQALNIKGSSEPGELKSERKIPTYNG